MFVFVMLLCVLLTVRWLRCVVAAAAAVATLLRSFEWILVKKDKSLVEWILTKLMYISLVQKFFFLDLRSDLRICFSVGQN